ncbi:MAG: 30S ribosomal protein S2 [Candidatus Marinimicrobia bacterium]|nr:30S ribosomal protein S2 [Candidatus Neomarinimicrobiota bacterium]|tara:strand:- start:7702 stop:8532 length:831 start_codon:yes stop_codon:yes gene_type:complete
MKMENMNIEKLITSGAHYGHPVNKWNPKFKPFIANKKNGIYIINLELTLQYLDKALKELVKISQKGGNVLFIGTKTQAKDIVQSCADKCGMFYIVERWLGGTLTNFSTIKKSIKRLVMLEKESSPIYKDKTKKERSMLVREKLKLSDLHRGIKDMKHLPSAIFVIDATHEKIAVSEAKCLGIPTFGLVDTNTDPFMVDYPIPANDDSIKTIQLIMSHITDTIHDSIGGSSSKTDEAKLEEVVPETSSKANEENVELVEENTSSDNTDEASDDTSKN